MSMRYYISTEEASFFNNNRMGYGTGIPTSGNYKVGDFIISSTQKDGIFGWVCTVSGTPGEWEVIGSGMNNGSGGGNKVVGYVNAVSFSNTRNSVEIGIDEYEKGKDFLEVHYNGLMLAEGVHYNVSSDGKSIEAIDGSWNENADDIQQMIFRVLKSEGVGLKELKNTINIDNACYEVELGIEGYNPDKDVIEVHLNGVLLVQGLDYNVSDGKIIKVDTSEAWNPYNVNGQKMFVKVMRNKAALIEPSDGSVTIDKLSPDVAEDVRAIDGLVNSISLQNNTISNIDNRIGALEEELDDKIANIDMSAKQDKTDNNLATNSKDIVGAINEVFQSGNNVKQNLVDALIAKGVQCSTSDSFSKLISLIYGLTNDDGSGDDTGNGNLPSFKGENSVADCTSMTINRTYASAAAVGKKIYVVGGENSTTIKSVECYDTETGLWESVDDLPSVRTKHITEAVGVNIFSIGGSDGTNAKDEVFVYESHISKTWTQLPSVSSMVLGVQSAASAVVGSKIYIFGGVDITGNQRDEVFIFDTDGYSWTYGTAWDYGHQMAGATAIGEKIYVVAGTYYKNSSSLRNNIIRCYDTTTDTWTDVSSLSYAANSPAVESYDGKVYISGGYTSTSTIENKITCYNPNDNTIEVINTMNSGRCRHASAVVDGIIYYIAGTGEGAKLLNSVEAYCPPGVEPPTSSSGTASSLGLNIISATELPESGELNQICVITDNPVEHFVLTSNIDDKSTATDVITIYVSNSSSYDTITGSKVSVASGNIVTNYYFNKMCQGDNRLESYIYRNDNWEQLTQKRVMLLEDGTYVNTNYHGNLATGGKIHYYAGEAITVDHINTAWYSALGTFAKPFDITLYSKIKCLAYINPTNSTVTATGKLFISMHKRAFGYSDYASGTEISAGVTADVDVLGKYDVQQLPLQEFTLDVSTYTGEYYVGFGGHTRCYGHIFIVDMWLE